MNTTFKSVLYTRLFMLLSFLILSPFPLYLSAQSSLEKAESAVNVASGIAGLFKKKKKDSTATNRKQEQATSAGGNVVIAGNILPDAKYIDAERMNRFTYGTSIVEKGNKKAVLSSTGNFIIPFSHSYNDIDKKKRLISATTDKGYHLYNYSGQKVAEINEYGWSWQGGLFHNRKNPSDIFIDYKGIRYSLKNETLSDGRTTSIIFGQTSDSALKIEGRLKNGGSLYGLKALSNKMIVQPKYDMIYDFIDGYAVYKTTDAYNKVQSGILNEKGVETSPRFSSLPEPMGAGYFIVAGNDDSPIQYAIITSTGDIVFKEMKNSGNFYRFTIYDDGYFFDNENDLIMDLKGNIKKQSEFLAKAGFSNNQQRFFKNSFVHTSPDMNEDSWYKDDILCFYYLTNEDEEESRRVSFSSKRYGFYNVKTGQIVLGNFVDPVFFDPISGLANVRKLTGKKTPSGAAEIITGAINRDGNFVIVQKAEKKSDF